MNITLDEIRSKAPDGATGYIIGRVTGRPIYLNQQNLVWCEEYQEWTSFTHNMEIKPL